MDWAPLPTWGRRSRPPVCILVPHDILPSGFACKQGRRFAEGRHELAVQRDVSGSLAAARRRWWQRKAQLRRTARRQQRGGSSAEAAAVTAAQQHDVGGRMAASAAVAAAQSAAAGHSATAEGRWRQHGGCSCGDSATAQRRRQRHRPRMRQRTRLRTPPTSRRTNLCPWLRTEGRQRRQHCCRRQQRRCPWRCPPRLPICRRRQ